MPIEQMNAEWQTLGRSPHSVRMLQLLAERDDDLFHLVHGGSSPLCPTPYDLIEHMRQAKGRRAREQAAALVSLMLREAEVDPLVARTLLQALIPGMVVVAGRLQWGRGGNWEDGNEFFSELLSTAYMTISDWSGQNRPYAVLDLLSAIRCRMRRQLHRDKNLRHQHVALTGAVVEQLTAPSETALELLTRQLITLQGEGMRSEDVAVLYAQHVLGFSISELALITGRDRRALYSRRDRGQRRLCA
jgi:DNA-directed RNA polymerase specialized sigma24 family protein